MPTLKCLQRLFIYLSISTFASHWTLFQALSPNKVSLSLSLSLSLSSSLDVAFTEFVQASTLPRRRPNVALAVNRVSGRRARRSGWVWALDIRSGRGLRPLGHGGNFKA